MTGCSKDSLTANCNSGSGDDCAGPPLPPQQSLDNGLSVAKSKSHHRSQSPAGTDDPTTHHHHHNHHRRPPPSSTPKRTSDRNNGGEDGNASSEDEKSSATAAATSKSGRVKQGSESSEDLGYKKSNRSALSCVDAESNTTNSGMLRSFVFYELLLLRYKKYRVRFIYKHVFFIIFFFILW